MLFREEKRLNAVACFKTNLSILNYEEPKLMRIQRSETEPTNILEYCFKKTIKIAADRRKYLSYKNYIEAASNLSRVTGQMQ